MNRREVKRAPTLRFKGFTNDWEQRKLGEIAKVIGGGTPSTKNSDYWNGNINWYSPTEIGKSNYIFTSKKKITKLGLENSSAKILPGKHTILFTSRAGIGKDRKRTRLNSSHVSISYAVFCLKEKNLTKA